MASDVYEVIVPTEEELEVRGDVVCPFDGCNNVFKSPASRAMHITRHHEGKNLAPVVISNTLKTKLYYCPVDGCTRSQGTNNKPFKKLGQVKQHYNLIHKEKRYTCEKCAKRFGMKDAYARHMKECGVIFTCESCELELKSYNALYQHCKRSGHVLKTKRKKPPNGLPGAKPSIVVAPLIVKAVLPILPTVTPTTGTTATVELKTTDTSSGVIDQVSQDDASQLVELATQTELTGYEFLTSTHSLHIQSDCKITKDVQTNPLSQCEFGTQTMPLLSDSWPQSLLHADLFDTETMDFGTQTLDTAVFNPYSTHEDLAIQTYNFTKDQGSQT